MRTIGYLVTGVCCGLLVAAVALLNEIGCCSGGTTRVVAGVVGAPFTLFGVGSFVAALFAVGMTTGWSALASRSYDRWAAGLFAVTMAIHYAAVPISLLWPTSAWRWGATRFDDGAMLLCMPVYALVHGWLWLVFVANLNRRWPLR